MSSHRHAFNIGLNVGGMVLPMLVGVLTVPGLLQRLGQEKFGVLARWAGRWWGTSVFSIWAWAGR